MCGGFLGDVFRVATAVVTVAVAVVTLNPFAIVAAVGAVTSVVGHYTGSKELSIAGGVIGAIGAIGGLANGAGLFDLADVGLDPASTGLRWGSEAAGVSSFGPSGAGELGLPGAGGGAAVGDTTVATMPDMVGPAGGVTVPGEASLTATGEGNPLGNVAANATSPNVTPEAAVDTGVPNTQMAGQEMVDASGKVVQGDSLRGGLIDQPPSASAPGAPAPTQPVTGEVNPMDAGMPGSYDISKAAAAAYGPAKVPPAAAPDIWDKLWKFVDSSGGGRIAAGALMAGGAFLSGATSSLTPAQVAALQAQAEANTAAANYSRQQAAMSQQQLANMNGPLPVATRTPRVTGVAAQAPVGMINTPPPLGPVTGAPA